MVRTKTNGKEELVDKFWRDVDIEVIVPPILLLTLLLIASLSPIATVVSLIIALPILLYRTRRHYYENNRLKQTKFFISWSLSSLIILILVFELEVIPFLEILFVENLVLISFISLALILVIFLRKSQIQINCEQNAYNYWIRSEISQRLYAIYILSQVLTTIALIYGSQLTLTTICHSSILFESVLIPDDCSEVYIDGDIKISFVCAIYSLQIAVCLMFSIMRRVFTTGSDVNLSAVKYVKLNQIDS